MQLADKVTVITGSGSGFGEGIAKACAREGASVVVSDINEDGGQRVTEEIAAAGGSVSFCQANVTNAGETQALIDHAKSTFGRLDVLVNNAGIGHKRKPMTEVTEEELDRIFAVNVKGLFFCARAAADQQALLGDQHVEARILHHKCQSLRRVRDVKRHVGAAGFEDAQNTHHHLG